MTRNAKNILILNAKIRRLTTLATGTTGASKLKYSKQLKRSLLCLYAANNGVIAIDKGKYISVALMDRSVLVRTTNQMKALFN